MKKVLTITLIILITIAMLGWLWWYLLVNGKPDGFIDIPNPFGSADVPIEFPGPDTEEQFDEDAVSRTTLRQISTEPVAGAAFVMRDDTLYIRYIERGTGRLFEHNTATGERARLVEATVPRVTTAVWSSSGAHAVLLRETTSGTTALLGTIVNTDGGATLLEISPLQSDIRNVAFSDDGATLYYTAAGPSGSTAYAHDTASGAREEIFQTPLRHIVVSSWNPILMYTTPSAHVRGYAYTGRTLERLVGGMHGLMAMRHGEATILSYAEDETLVSRVLAINAPPLLEPVFPEKCVSGHAATTTTLWCASPLDMQPGTYPDTWYQGITSFNDILWELDTALGSGSPIKILYQEAGGPIDAIHMTLAPQEQMLLFINKRNGSLWVQELAQTPEAPVQNDEED